MEKQSFKDILVTDTEFYVPNTSCGKYVKRKELTLDDLLGPNYEIIHKNSRSHTRRQLETLVTMLRYIYLGESLPKINIEQLDYYLSFDHMINKNTRNLVYTHWGAIVFDTNNNRHYINLTDYFCYSIDDIATLYEAYYIEKIKEHNNKTHKLKMIDFFKWKRLKKEQYLYPYVREYIEAYNINYLSKEQMLLNQIDELIEQRKTIDEKILSLYEQLESFSDVSIREKIYKSVKI